MEEAGSILKKCEEFIVQSTGTIAHSLKLLQPGVSLMIGEDHISGGMGTSSLNNIDSEDTSDDPSSKVKCYHWLSEHSERSHAQVISDLPYMSVYIVCACNFRGQRSLCLLCQQFSK